jgi:RNA polymerase sigma-70 factor (ECF subfamily)
MNANLQDDFLNQLNPNTGIIHRVCHSYFTDPDDRQDAFQEIVYQLWRSYPSFNHHSKFTTWMYKVAINTAIMHVRKNYRSIPRESLNESFLQIASVDDSTASHERMQLLYAAINTLNTVDKAIILLYLDDNSYDEIASVTGLTKTNISVKLVRIKRKLEEKLKDVIF